MRAKFATFGLITLCIAAAPATANAFCGFYVSGAEGKIFNNATQVVLMRHNTRTVMSMQNNYEGPPQDFAMVVPVPVVLQKENVKTLPESVFDRVDKLAAPRLVEYWEKDPCQFRRPGRKSRSMAKPSAGAAKEEATDKKKDLGVTIEAKFEVKEYQILILSAKDSTGLDTWLRREKYKIPQGAAAALKPYVAAGMKFFVAKVDYKKVRMVKQRPTLRPLRFHFDSPTFSLPIRLGMLNSKGKQDLIVHILAPNKRYEVANYKNVLIPTNLDVSNATRKHFGEFYAALFDATLKKNPGAVVTEYSWDSNTCDPCPTPPLGYRDLAYLGTDVLYAPPAVTTPPPTPPTTQPATGTTAAGPPSRTMVRRRPMRRFRRGLVLTRLHARYGKDSVKNDLVFKVANAIQGGREGFGGKRRRFRRSSSRNMFQGRYAIRHKWTGRIDCKNPQRGRWGGPPRNSHRRNPGAKAALDLAFAKRGAKLTRFVRTDVPALGIKAAGAPAVAAPVKTTTAKPKTKSKKKKGCSVTGSGNGTTSTLLLLGAAVLLARRSRRRR